MVRQQTLFDRLASDLELGEVQWIGLRPQRKQPMLVVNNAMAIAGRGLEGDRRMFASEGSARQITIISAEHIEVAARLLKRDRIDPSLLRRNVVVSGINLNALRHQQFIVGEAVLQATAACHPCSRMDKNLGPGGHAAMLGHGGLCARILKDGLIRVGDPLRCLSAEERLPIE